VPLLTLLVLEKTLAGKRQHRATNRLWAVIFHVWIFHRPLNCFVTLAKDAVTERLGTPLVSAAINRTPCSGVVSSVIRLMSSVRYFKASLTRAARSPTHGVQLARGASNVHSCIPVIRCIFVHWVRHSPSHRSRTTLRIIGKCSYRQLPRVSKSRPRSFSR